MQELTELSVSGFIFGCNQSIYCFSIRLNMIGYYATSAAR